MFDPFGFQNQINSMMRGFMVDPFGQPPQQQQQQQRTSGNQRQQPNNQSLAMRDPFFSPFERHHQMMLHHDPFQMMNQMMSNMHGGGGGGGFRNMNQHFVSSDPNAQVFSSSSVVTYSNTGDGKPPKVYQESKQIRHGPGGVKEVREVVRDTSKGLEKVAIGHHIGDRAHIIERKKENNGEMEEIVNLENLDEEELNEFNQEFESRIAPHARQFNANNAHHRSLHLNNNHPLAIEHGSSRGEKSKDKDRKSSKSRAKH